MHRINKIDVFYHDRHVGTMALYENRLAAFEYDGEWLQDGWGRLLVDRLMRRNGINPQTIGSLERLAIVGNSGMGALTYRPVISMENVQDNLSLDEIAQECSQILNTEFSENLDYLFAKGGASGGARPKILTKVGEEDWIIKFPSSDDSRDIGKQEYDYALCAKACGIDMEEVRLFPSNKTKGYFGTRRFDRKGKGEDGKVHMVSAAGLLETSHRIPNLDYDILMKLTLQLTRSMEECEKLYRFMCFNVFAHNRDDHSKNFTYLYEEKAQRWILSPAYNLTYSSSLGGEHATTVNGNGVNPGMEDILAVAEKTGLNIAKSRKTAKEIQECIYEMLGDYITY